MRKTFRFLLPCLLAAGMFTACEEVEEESLYANWQVRNEAFTDSLATLAGNNIATLENIDKMTPGEMFAVKVENDGTIEEPYYVYCKKLVSTNGQGKRPNYTGENSNTTVFYYGTYVTGSSFDGNFEGYSAADKEIALPLGDNSKQPSEFNSPVSFSVSGMVKGWIWAMQYMREGERWMVYIPWESGYGESDRTSSLSDGSTKTIPGHSALTFDIILEAVK